MTTTGPLRDPRDISIGPDAYNAELARKIDEIQKIVVTPIRTREDI